MSTHRARHSRAHGGLRPVGEILARVATGPAGTVSVQPPRSLFTVATAVTAGAGVAAAMTGAFPAIQGLPPLEVNDAQSAPSIFEPTAMEPPTSMLTPTAHPSTGSTPGSTAPHGTVMAEDLHHTNAMQIAALSHAASMSPRSGSVPTPRSSGSRSGSLEGGVLSELSMPTSIRGVPISGPAGSTTAALALRTAITKVGLPYVWGAAGPNAFDCSGLVLWAYRQFGVNLPHSAAQQSRMGTPVSRANLRPGDLVFFYSPVSHEGIYLGNNKIFNAFDSGQPLKVSDMSRMPFHNARRL